MKPHKWQKEMDAFNAGIPVQYEYDGKWYDAESPTWEENCLYRIKPTPHKWAREIKAWADGVEIEYRCGYSDWTADIYPQWDNDNFEFRIKGGSDGYTA